DVHAVGQCRNVEAQRALADRVEQARVRARAALVPGHVQAGRVACRILAQRIEVRRLALVAVHPAQQARRRAGIACLDLSFGMPYFLSMPAKDSLRSPAVEDYSKAIFALQSR